MLDFSVTLVITIINIIFLSLILRVILWKPVTKFMTERAKRVQDSIAQAEREKAQAGALLSQYEAKLKNAEAEAEAVMRKARAEAGTEAERIIAESRAAAEQTLANAKKQLEKEHEAAMELFRKEAASLVVAAAGRLVGREINSDDNEQYAAMLLNEASPHAEAGKN